MPWWSNNFLSSSSSSAASSPRSPKTTDRHHPRRLTRLRKIRHLPEWEIAGVLSKSVSCDNIQSSRSSLAVPQPLPEPEPANKEWASLLQRDRDGHENSKGKFPLPSPKEAASRGSNDRDKSDAVVGNGTASDGLSLKVGIESRSARQDAQKSSDSIGTQSNRKVPRDKKGVGSSRENFVLNVPVRSAPTSAYSSPIPSPQRMSTGDLFYHLYTPTQGLQVWSAPEMPTGFPSQMSSDVITFSPDSTPFYGSPLHSPRVKSPRRNNARSPTRSASPLHKIVSIDISPAARESNGNANVHPLPLPPGATMSSQPVPVPQVPAKTELLPMTSQWQKGKLIGRGTFGSVYMATNLQTGALCAMKEVLLCPDDPKSAECIKQLEQEIKVLSHLKHTNIVQYYGSEIVGDKFYIYLEYVYPGSINKYVNEHCGAITECVVRNFTRHILSGLAYLHSTKTIHRDIKGANLLVDSSGVVKLADFGMAKHLTGPVADLSLKGSPYWMAPELMQCVMQKDNSSDSALAVDIWSLGCTIIEMLNGKPPWSEYEGAAAMFKVMRETPSIPESLSPEGKDFLRCCFQRNPAERPSASKLLEHRFLKNSQQSDVSSCTQGFSALKLQDKVHSPRERSIRNFDNLPTGAQTSRGKFASDSETGQQSHHETNDLTVACHHSPRSTLETLPSLSPPHSGCSTHHPSPSGKGSNGTKHGSSRKNPVFW